MKKQIREWRSALLFAMIAAFLIRTFLIEPFRIPTSSMEGSLLVGDFLFVSKLSYGPRTPITPIAFPFVHNKYPFTEVKSYYDGVELPYYRLKGFGKIKRNDVVVFNYPVELFHPVDKREHYIKRCVGIPGDSLEVKSSILYINGIKGKNISTVQKRYLIETDDASNVRKADLLKLGVRELGRIDGGYVIFGNEKKVEAISAMAGVKKVHNFVFDTLQYDPEIFPKDENYKWNVDQFGPIKVPKRGDSVRLNEKNFHLYQDIIVHYEGNDAIFTDGVLFINGEKKTFYTFKMDYYFMMGDNRHNSLDSRYWGLYQKTTLLGRLYLCGSLLTIWKKISSKKYVGQGFLKRLNNQEITYLPVSYFPPISWWVFLFRAKEVTFDVHEHLIKQTPRTRCEIAGPQGKSLLIIPINKRGKRQAIKDVTICNETDWQKKHFTTIATYYRSTPYFELYEDFFSSFFSIKYSSLLSLFETSFSLIQKLLDVSISYSYTEKYLPFSENEQSFREFNRKKEVFVPKYTQRFEHKHGFLQDLSILDMLFNLGPSSTEIIKK